MKKSLNIQITERDIEIFSFINEYGFCEMRQLQKQFQLKKARSYQLIKRLVQNGYLHHMRLFYKKPGVYHLTKKGARHTDLPSLRQISLRDYNHHLTVIDVAMRLKELYPESAWISERYLLHEKYKEGFRMKGHLADGVLILPLNKENPSPNQNGIEGRVEVQDKEDKKEKKDKENEKNRDNAKKIAIEVELSAKSKKRVREILRKYGAQYAFKEVWYYCHPTVLNHLKTMSQKIPFIKVFNIEELLK